MDPQPPAKEPTPVNGWDLLDDYQVGKDSDSGSELQTKRIAAAAPVVQNDTPAGEPAPADPAQRTSRFWERKGTSAGSVADDAAIIARIMGRKQEREDEAQRAIDRAATANAQDERERVRERQRREIEAYQAMQLRNEAAAAVVRTSLQEMLAEVANIFLALGICPDHLEYVADAGAFCSWSGRLYDHSELFSLRDNGGRSVYTVGPGPDGDSTVAYSPRERGWRLDRPVAPQTHLIPVERLLPTPRRHADGSLWHSAQRARTVLMEEGSCMVYVVGNCVYTTSHLRAAHHLNGSVSILDKVVAPADKLRNGTAQMARTVTRAVQEHHSSAIEVVTDIVGSATDTVTRVLNSTTRLFRRKR